MYCGDETGSYIGDVGSHSCRFGYGGEDNPKYVMPSYVCNKSHMASSCLSERIAKQDVESILRTPQSLSLSSSINSNNEEESSLLKPITDPNSFLCQGDMIENWDNLQIAWHNSMDALHAKDTLKHTSGGSPYSATNATTTTTTTTAGGSGGGFVGGGGSNKVAPGDGKCVHPILAVTPGITHLAGYGPSYCAAQRRQQQIKYTEMLMESLEASAVFLAPAPMLSAFSFGRQTALVVDIGAGGCRVTPVLEGLVLGQSQKRNGRGGDWLSNITWRALLDEKITPVPRYQLRNKAASSVMAAAVESGAKKETATTLPLLQAKKPLFHQWAMQDLMYGIMTDSDINIEVSFYDKEPKFPFLDSQTTQSSPSSPSSSPQPSSPEVEEEEGHSSDSDIYQLPDGTSIDLTSQLATNISSIPDLLFADTLPFQQSSASATTTTTTNIVGGSTMTNYNDPLHKLIRESLLAVGDVDARKELANCITLVGGTSVIPNLDSRLSSELSNLLPQFVKPKVVASRFNIERSCSAWIGGSILTSLGSFQQLWLSRTEYEEYGVTLSIQRFP